jgi:acyl-coenzyme A synthetase/AMP-(fatty) acid ligase
VRPRFTRITGRDRARTRACRRRPDEALRRHCAERLADYEVPGRFIWSTLPLPRNANGKVMKRSLRELHPVPEGVSS